MRNKPRIRFKGFTEDWEQRKLGALMEVTSVKRIHQADWTDSGVRFFRARDIVSSMNNEEVDNPVFISEDKYEEYSRISGKVIEGDLLVTGVGTIGVPYLIKDATPLYFKDGNIIWFKNNNILNGKYFYYCFQNNHIQSQIYSASGKGTVGTYTIENGKKTSISYPSLKEQVQIGKLLDTMTIMITLHQHKLEKLKLAKKALLQKLFPKNGSQFPEIRFKGFTDAWEQCKLSDISTKVTTKNVNVQYTETLTNSAEQGIISQVDFFDKEISNKDNINGYYIVDNNDFIYNPRISTLAPVGPINRNKLNRTGIMSPLYTVFRSSNVDLGFLEWYFQSSHWHRYMKLNGDSGVRADRIAIKDSTFFEMPIKIPVNIKEQVLIGETLEKFNQYITLHQRKLDKLQDVKKGLLQKMFV